MSLVQKLTEALREQTVNANRLTIRVGLLESLVSEYYHAALIGMQMEDPTVSDSEHYERMINTLNRKTLAMLPDLDDTKSSGPVWPTWLDGTPLEPWVTGPEE